MSNEQIKLIYNISRKFTYAIFFVSILFIIFNIYKSVSIIFLIGSSMLGIINCFNAKIILKSEVISENSMFLIAATIIFNLLYLAGISFLLGRSFIRQL